MIISGVEVLLDYEDEKRLSKYNYHRSKSILNQTGRSYFVRFIRINGKEIFEGDRVKVVIICNELNHDIKREFVSTITFSEHRGCYIFPDYHNVSVDDAREGDEMISFEVIGNIHE